MVFFITFLRAIAACLITNAHYTGVYPTDLIANGGLIGDVLFFAISGYCLYSIRTPFVSWYGKRLYRIYPPVIGITLIYAVMGFYNVTKENCLNYFLYPTNYHFIASIVVLYIFFYFIMKVEWLKKRINFCMLLLAIVWFGVYLFVYDKTYYHIDNVYEPMIRFLFLESMLLGAYFKQNDVLLRNKFKWSDLCGIIVSFILYFGSKLLFSKVSEIACMQFLNQILIFLLLYFVFKLLSGLDSELEKLPIWCKKIINIISSMTLEIYLVQYVLIDELRTFATFPVNWIVLTISIFISAWMLHKVCGIFYSMIEMWLKKCK